MDIDQALKFILQKNTSSQFHLEQCYHVYLEQLQSYLNHLSTSLYPHSAYDPASLSIKAAAAASRKNPYLNVDEKESILFERRLIEKVNIFLKVHSGN